MRCGYDPSRKPYQIEHGIQTLRLVIAFKGLGNERTDRESLQNSLVASTTVSFVGCYKFSRLRNFANRPWGGLLSGC